MIALSQPKICRLLCWFALALSGCTSKNSVPVTDSQNTVAPVAASQKTTLFQDVATRAGLNWKHNLGDSGEFYFIESTPSGCAFLDFDNDGWQDIFLVQSGAPVPKDKNYRRPFCALYRNNGNGTFVDVTRAAGLEKDFGYAQGVTVGDYDNDGFDDLFVTAYGGNALLHNEGGKAFRDVTQAMKMPTKYGTGYATSAAFGDYDNDGKLDLYVCHYAQWTPATNKKCRARDGGIDYCSPLIYQPESDRLYRNEGTRFRDVSEESGIAKARGRGLAVAFVDYNSDGKQDIFVANDLTPNLLWRNDGKGHFTDVAVETGCAYGDQSQAMAGMGVAVADYNRSGRPSLYVSNFSSRPNVLFKNEGTYFQEESTAANLIESHLDLLSFGCEFLDYDADGWPDIVANNGHVQQRKAQREPGIELQQRKQLLRNLGDGTFADIALSELGDLKTPRVGRGLAVGDYDNDGRVDILAMNQNAAPQLFRNESLRDNHWVSFATRGTKSNRDGLHTRLEIKAGGARQTSSVRAGSSYLSSSDHRVYFGLKDATEIDELKIIWPSGTRETLKNLKADQFYTLTEGKGVTAKKSAAK